MTPLPLLPLVLDRVPIGLRLALAQEGIPAVDFDEARANDPQHQAIARERAGRFVLYDSQSGQGPRLADGQTPIDIHPLRRGAASDPFAGLLDERSARHRWRIGPVEASEEIARVDKRSLRQSLVRGLRARIEAAGGIWLRVAAYPFPYRTAFNFRLDHDEFDRADLAAVLRAIAGHEAAFSHYICGATHERHLESLAPLRGMDIGSHGYWHHTYRLRQENLRNLERGIEVLQRGGMEPSGFVAPHGRFNRGLLWAMEQLDIGHSSEFGLGYDDLPFYPANSQVLQIPVYPICLGICLEAWRRSPHGRINPAPVVEAFIGHLQHVAQARYDAGLPIFLYGHPDGRLGRYPQVLLRVLESVGGLAGVWHVDRTRFAAWWRDRGRVKLCVEQENDFYTLRAHGIPAGQPIAVEYWRGDHVAVMPVGEPVVRFAPAALAFERRTSLQVPRAIRIDRPEGLRGALRRWLDWERVTPVEEIDATSLRGWTKKVLRRIRK